MWPHRLPLSTFVVSAATRCEAAAEERFLPVCLCCTFSLSATFFLRGEKKVQEKKEEEEETLLIPQWGNQPDYDDKSAINVMLSLYSQTVNRRD